MLIGFKRRFAPFVEDGSKTHTIRAIRKIPPRVGEMCHCYVDPRQKTMRLLGRWPCVKVERIEIFRDATYHIAVDGVELSAPEMDLLAWRDGFRPPLVYYREFAEFSFRPHTPSEANPRGCSTDMLAYWQELHDLPFQGQIIHWKRPA